MDEIYEALKERPDIDEVDPMDLEVGMVLVGNRETVRSLVEDFVASLQRAPDGESGVVNAVLSQSHALSVVAHDCWAGDRPGVKCSFDMGSPLALAVITIPYGDPVLVRAA